MAEEKPTKHRVDFKDISGQQFGYMTVIAFHETRGKNTYWLCCCCACGTNKIVARSNLFQGTKSCGCSSNEFKHRTHGMYGSPEYKSWAAAKQRCLNPNTPGFEEYYGGRNITMCAEWCSDFMAFFRHIGPRPKGTSLDRIDNEKGYEPGNVRWATPALQMRNTRRTITITHNGETLTLTEWSERTGIPRVTLWERNDKGLPLFVPLRHIGHRGKRS